MDLEKKEALSAVLNSVVERGQAVGVQAAVYERGQEVYYDACGFADRERGLPMERNSICRMYSMTKPVTAVAAWILYERGLLDFREEAARFLPEFGGVQVLSDGHTVPVREPITVAHLLNMTSGIVYPDVNGDAAGKAMAEQFADIHRRIDENRALSTREVLKRIAACPLAFQPGERWRYGLSADVLGGVIEAVSGMCLREFFKKEIFEPLEMWDTDFYVPKEKQGRFAQLYRCRERGGCCVEQERTLGLTLCLQPPAFESAGAGLVSTLEDYAHFACMLAAGGIWKGRRILGEGSVKAFCRNGLSKELMPTIYFPQMEHYGYGNLMRVGIAGTKGPRASFDGEFGWDGWAGPYFAVFSKEERVLLYFVQVSACLHWDDIFRLRNILNGERR